MEEKLIAPCGINCAVCSAYQSMDKDLNKLGFRRKYCPGCIPRGKNCLHMGHQCELLREGKVRFCFECDTFPCKRLKALDKRYSGKYRTNVIENLKNIQANGMDAFLEKEKVKWRCPTCGGVICCHSGQCLSCSLQALREDKVTAGSSGKTEKLNLLVRKYTIQLSKGQIQRAYKGILSFLSGLGTYLRDKYPDYTLSALYPGYMDMSYFAFTPQGLKDKMLKIAVVYLHEENRFEAWLGGINRKVQTDYIVLLSHRDIGSYRLSSPAPGVDAIIETVLVKQPDFDRPAALREQIEKGLIVFIRDITVMLDT
jgi:hypothetical protein